MQSETISFTTLHSPRGAFAHFALGRFGEGGGFALESDRVADGDVFIGIRRGDKVTCFPFFQNAASSDLDTFLGETKRGTALTVTTFPTNDIRRRLGAATDEWSAPDIEFSIFDPVDGLPEPPADPEKTSDQFAFKDAIAPALAARLTVDNRSGTETIQGVFATRTLRGLRWLERETRGKLTGWASILGFGFACDAARHPDVQAVSHWDLPSLFTPPHPLPFSLAGMAALIVDVPPGQIRNVDFALGWYRGGTVTEGLHQCAYTYTEYFGDLVDVLSYAQDRLADWRTNAHRADKSLRESRLNEDQQFIIAQSTRCYWASSMLLSDERPAATQLSHDNIRWVVNEGSFVMINTFDLAVDHLFFELRYQPWVVRNILDSFVKDYAYTDDLYDPTDGSKIPGGLSFTHDQGAYNTFSPAGESTYEVCGQPGCYAYMTQEQLINWIVSATAYVSQSEDIEWAVSRSSVFRDCLGSMLCRDHPDPKSRDGVMDFDSARAGASGEITTYDSLDASLGQARRNLYLAVKGWAAYLGLDWIFRHLDDVESASQARRSARLAAKTIADAFDPSFGYIPAILDSENRSAIIPAVEGLVFPHIMGLSEVFALDGPYGKMIYALRRHLMSVLRPGLCLFDDQGWRLSAGSENSWISKVFLCQFVAREILGVYSADQRIEDRTHADWWRLGSPGNPGIDQVFAGKTSEVGFYYPRAVTSILWLTEAPLSVRSNAEVLSVTGDRGVNWTPRD